MKNGFFKSSLTLAISLYASSSFAFINSDTEQALIKKLNQEFESQDLNFNDIRCSRRQSSCFIKFEAHNHEALCTIEKVSTVYDFVEQKGTDVSLAPAIQSELSNCVKKIL